MMMMMVVVVVVVRKSLALYASDTPTFDHFGRLQNLPSAEAKNPMQGSAWNSAWYKQGCKKYEISTKGSNWFSW